MVGFEKKKSSLNKILKTWKIFLIPLTSPEDTHGKKSTIALEDEKEAHHPDNLWVLTSSYALKFVINKPCFSKRLPDVL